ncbi:MAG: EAL domain-containing protein [Ilumatobacteraceae bacterium]
MSAKSTRELAAACCWAVICGLTALVVPETWMGLVLIVAGLVVAALGVLQWLRTRVLGPMVLMSVGLAILGGLANALWESIGPLDVMANSVLVGIVFYAFRVWDGSQGSSRLLEVAWVSVPAAVLAVWVLVVEQAVGANVSAGEVVWSGLYFAVSLGGMPIALVSLTPQRRTGALLAATAMVAVLMIGEVMYAGELGQWWALSDRAKTVPYAVAWGLMALIFAPTFTKSLMGVRRASVARWVYRRRSFVVVVVVAVSVAVVVPSPESHWSLLVRWGLTLTVVVAAVLALTGAGVSEQRVNEQRIGAVLTDEVTGLPTFAAATARCSEETEGPVAALMVLHQNLDDLDLIYGTAVRDKVVSITANRARTVLAGAAHHLGVRADGRVLVLLPGERSNVTRMADLVLRAVSAPVTPSEGTFQPRVVVAYADASSSGDLDDLVRRAMRAGHQALRIGALNCLIAESDVGETLALRDLATIEAATTAIDTASYRLQLRFVVGQSAGAAVHGLHTVASWTHGDVQFDMADVERLVMAADTQARALQHTIAAAADECSRQVRAGRLPGDSVIYVDASPLQLTHELTLPALRETSRRTAIPLDRFVLLVKERDLSVGDESLATAMETMVAAGPRIGISHFGEGSLSLGRLRGYPVSYVVIADTIAAQSHRESQRKLINAIAAAGDHLGFRVITPSGPQQAKQSASTMVATRAHFVSVADQ